MRLPAIFESARIAPAVAAETVVAFCGNVQERALIRRAGADVGVAVRAEHIHRTRLVVRVGPLTGNKHNAWRHLVADPQREADGRPIIEKSHELTMRESSRTGVFRMEYTEWPPLPSAQEANRLVGRMRLKISRRGQQSKRPARSVARFIGILLPIRQG